MTLGARPAAGAPRRPRDGFARRVQGAYAALPDLQQTVLQLARLGSSYTQIAATLDVPPSTVMREAYGALRTLREVH